MSGWLSLVLALAGLSTASGATAPRKPKPTNTVWTQSMVLSNTVAGDWRSLDPEQTLYLELPSGRVIIELCPAFAPHHVANVKQLAREHYYDGLAIVRAQDNYVVQWADPNAEKPDLARPIRTAQKTLPGEFERALDTRIPWTPLPDLDPYAREVGFSNGFPVARDTRTGKMWLVHTYGMVGAGRDVPLDSGGGAELYAVIGHAPRHLDRNVTLFGRVVKGMELLSSLPRGPAPMGFYTDPAQLVPIRSVRVAADVPEMDRTPLQILRTEGPTFRRWIEARRSRQEQWYRLPVHRIEIGNVPIPTREP